MPTIAAENRNWQGGGARHSEYMRSGGTLRGWGERGGDAVELDSFTPEELLTELYSYGSRSWERSCRRRELILHLLSLPGLSKENLDRIAIDEDAADSQVLQALCLYEEADATTIGLVCWMLGDVLMPVEKYYDLLGYYHPETVRVARDLDRWGWRGRDRRSFLQVLQTLSQEGPERVEVFIGISRNWSGTLEECLVAASTL